MPQIAQQDYITISIVSPQNPTVSEKAEIKKHVQNGTIWDVIIEYVGDFGRVVGVSSAGVIYFYSPPDEEIVFLSYEE